MTDDVDTLGRWMSHHLAERITAAEEEPDPKERKRLQDECRKLIMDLWEHRASLPGRARPLASLTEILNAIVDLRSNEAPYWGRTLRGHDTHGNPWLKFAKEIEGEALDTVRLAIFQALAESSLPDDADKVKKFREFLTDKEVRVIDELQRLLQPTKHGSLYDEQPDVDPDKHVREEKTLQALQTRLERLSSCLDELKIHLAGPGHGKEPE